jgi:glycolate oxidase
VAENAGGPRALKYGVTREYVLGLEVVLPTGEILRTGRRTIKGVAGYDLTGLFVGSEGTLGIVTEITLKLVPRPRRVATALVCFRDLSSAARAVARVLAQGVVPRCLELLDDTSLAAAARSSPFRFPPSAGAALLVEVDGHDEEQVLAEIVRVAELVQGEAEGEVIVAQNEAQRRDIWEMRKFLSTSLKSLHPRKLSEDVAVPRSRIPEMVARSREIAKRRGLAVATYARGRQQPPRQRPLDARRPKWRRRWRGAWAAVDLGGTITGEHGVRLASATSWVRQGRDGGGQRRLKALFDRSGS